MGADRDSKPVAVVLLSGGLDSTTCLAMATNQGFTCHALSVSYGQRHTSEIEAAKRIASVYNVRQHQHIHVNLDAFGGSALTDPNIQVPLDQPMDSTAESRIPVTYVPARNTLFLSLALGMAETLNAWDIFIGVNAVDYSGYPDCRPEFIAQFSKLASTATRAGVEEGREFKIHTPLIKLTKAEIIKAGMALGVDYSQTVSCYQADESGRACGHCDACQLRKAGFLQSGVPDPTRYQ
ncbi:MAG: 7-cyano-7-deazaguanine synthase QueC [Salinisphaeraceae bacterium]|nr:7-cyano-7-deazaguanine synthase QueC [Salinisphaeraceae bacterium]